jgi:5-oxopent-3-ene-1,2,5-tricarboxylate decarboxylase / 2-hydroxyhepta-2,4-diene-1,7-dioate isomerase
LLVAKVIYNNENYYVTPSVLFAEKYEILAGDFINGFSVTGETVPISEVTFLVPIEPGKIIGIGKNYPGEDEKAEGFVNFFLMGKNALLPHKEDLVLPKRIGSLIPEGELAVIIGSKLKNASLEEAANSILGFTICNDFSARDTNPPESNAAIRKSSDGLLPTGPFILLQKVIDNFPIRTFLNGNLIQSGNSSEMIHKIPEIISYISEYMTLNPFDLISTGTPGPKIKVGRGDILTIEIDRIGSLTNRIV